MRAVWTLWCAPSQRHSWAVTATCMALSLTLGRRWFRECVVHTDSIGADRLEMWGLDDLADVRVTHDRVPAPAWCWAAGKLMTYGLQEAPFVHVDNDVFFFRHVVWPSPDGRVIVQHLERGKTARVYPAAIAAAKAAGTPLPPEVLAAEKCDRFIAGNVGVIAALDAGALECLRVWSGEILAWLASSAAPTQHLDAVFEQLYLYELARAAGRPLLPLFGGAWPEDECRWAGYCHLMGSKDDSSPSGLGRVVVSLEAADPTLLDRLLTLYGTEIESWTGRPSPLGRAHAWPMQPACKGGLSLE